MLCTGWKKWYNLKVNERHGPAKYEWRPAKRGKDSFARGWYQTEVNLLEKKNESLSFVTFLVEIPIDIAVAVC